MKSPWDVKQTIDGRWIVLNSGIQWGVGPRDASGCSSQEWRTEQEANQAIHDAVKAQKTSK